MDWARRSADDEPEMVQRDVEDGRGRRWTGSVRSGTLRGGEDNADVIFVCRDQPGELKRVARLDVPAEDAAKRWRRMDDAEVRAILDRSEPT